jgi:quinolinate synthase
MTNLRPFLVFFVGPLHNVFHRTEQKNAGMQKLVFLKKIAKIKENRNIFIFCHNFQTN